MADIFDQITSSKTDIFDEIQPEQSNSQEIKPPSTYERIEELPGSANRSFLQGTGYQQGAENFRNVPKYEDLYGQSAMDLASKIPGVSKLPLGGPQETALATAGIIPRMAGRAVDIATNPADLLAILAMEPLAKGIGEGSNLVGKGVSSIVKPFRAIGSEISPKAVESVSSNIRSMNPSTLKEIGFSPENLSRTQELSKEYGIKTLPSKEEANNLMGNVMKQKAENITPEEVLPQIKSSISELSSGLGKPPRLANDLKLIEDDLKNNPIINDAQYKATRTNLNNLISGNPELDRHIYAVKDALDKDAAHSGITGIKTAKAQMEMANMPKAEAYLNKPNLEKSIQSLLKQAQKGDSEPIKQQLRNLLGNEAEPILKALEKNKYQKLVIKGAGALASIPILKKTGILKFLIE